MGVHAALGGDSTRAPAGGGAASTGKEGGGRLLHAWSTRMIRMSMTRFLLMVTKGSGRVVVEVYHNSTRIVSYLREYEVYDCNRRERNS